MEKLFYRVHHPRDLGLWYNGKAEFTNEIEKLDLKCAKLDMSFDDNCAGGFISCTDTLDNLYNWFSREELLKLVDNGYDVLVFKAEESKFHEKFKHHLFKKEGSIIVAKINII